MKTTITVPRVGKKWMEEAFPNEARIFFVCYVDDSIFCLVWWGRGVRGKGEKEEEEEEALLGGRTVCMVGA